MATIIPRHHVELNSFRPTDFETASIRSAAPSYLSEAPSYHTTISSNNEQIPDYSPRTRNTNNNNNSAPSRGHNTRIHSSPAIIQHQQQQQHQIQQQQVGLPPVPGARHGSIFSGEEPTLAAFSFPTWSRVATNPTYERVANRRAQALQDGSVQRVHLERVDESGQDTMERLRPLEDPYLVGEVAANQAREERLARENGIDVLIREDKRWDWFLAQMSDMEEREQSWKNFRERVESKPKGKLAKRLGGRGFGLF